MVGLPQVTLEWWFGLVVCIQMPSIQTAKKREAEVKGFFPCGGTLKNGWFYL